MNAVPESGLTGVERNLGMQRMDFETLVQTRRSVRGFKQQPVPRAVIEEIIEVAKRAPSSMNTQPWHIHVLTGEPLERVRRRNMEEMMAGAKPQRDIVSHGEYQGVHRGRQVDIAKKLFAVMGIERDDKPIEPFVDARPELDDDTAVAGIQDTARRRRGDGERQ